MSPIEKALFTNNVAMLLYGLSAVLIGPTLPGIIASFDLSLTQAGFIGAMQNAGGIVGALVALLIADRSSHTKLAVVSFGFLGCALLAVGISAQYRVLLASFALTGIFIRILDVMFNAATGDFAAVRGKHTVTELREPEASEKNQETSVNRSGRDLNTLHMFFSIGAFAGPVTARAIMGAGMSWSQVFRWTGLTYLLVIAASLMWLRQYVRITTGRDEGGDEAQTCESSPVPVPQTVTGMTVSILGGLFFFYAIHQVGIVSWIPYFLETVRGASPDAASIGLSAYWIGIIGGRFLSSRLVEPVGAYPLLFGGCLAAAAATLLAVLVSQPLEAQVLLLIAGVSGGATIPLGYSVAYQFNPSRTGTVTATLAIIMLAGRFLGPWAIGIVADRTGLVGAMSITGWSLLFSGALAAALWVLHRRGSAPPVQVR